MKTKRRALSRSKKSRKQRGGIITWQYLLNECKKELSLCEEKNDDWKKEYNDLLVEFADNHKYLKTHLLNKTKKLQSIINKLYSITDNLTIENEDLKKKVIYLTEELDTTNNLNVSQLEGIDKTLQENLKALTKSQPQQNVRQTVGEVRQTVGELRNTVTHLKEGLRHWEE